MERPINAIQRLCGLTVRYWSFNMTLVHQQGATWPGFGYTDEEKQRMKTIAQGFDSTEYYFWMGIVVAAFFAMLIPLIYTEIMSLDPKTTSESSFMIMLATTMMLALSVGFFSAMLIGAFLMGKIFKVPDEQLPDEETTDQLFRKLWFQITRVALVCPLVVIGLYFYLPKDSKIVNTLSKVVPVVAPAVSVLTATFFFRRRIRS